MPHSRPAGSTDQPERKHPAGKRFGCESQVLVNQAQTIVHEKHAGAIITPGQRRFWILFPRRDDLPNHRNILQVTVY